MVKDVTIFTTSTCASCGSIKKWLGVKGVGYTEVNLDQNPERQAEAFALSGAMTVPVTVVTRQDDSQEVIVGPNFGRLAPAIV